MLCFKKRACSFCSFSCCLRPSFATACRSRRSMARATAWTGTSVLEKAMASSSEMPAAFSWAYLFSVVVVFGCGGIMGQ